jgi:hypothetical protein
MASIGALAIASAPDRARLVTDRRHGSTARTGSATSGCGGSVRRVQSPQRFRVRLDDAGGGGAAFGLPARAAAALGERQRPPVTVTIRGYTFRTTGEQ